MGHDGSSVPPTTGAQKKGDERTPSARLRAALPDACARLNVFQWEWEREYDVEYDADSDTWLLIGAGFVEAKGKPVSCPQGVNKEGLAEAAENVARWVQAELHTYGNEPLELRDVWDLWNLRLGYQNALYWLDGNCDRLWKEVESRVAPGGVALSICVGSNKRIGVPVFFHGKPLVETMHGYLGCLRTFPEAPYGRGRPWSRWCPQCRSRKTNAKRRAITAFQRRIAEIGARGLT